jgi:hypothetical protein
LSVLICKTSRLSTPFYFIFKLYSVLPPEVEEESEHLSCVPYATVIKSIMYARICTHLDISHVISMVIRFMRNSGKVH